MALTRTTGAAAVLTGAMARKLALAGLAQWASISTPVTLVVDPATCGSVPGAKLAGKFQAVLDAPA